MSLKLSVVIPTYNQEEAIELSLPAVMDQNVSRSHYEVVIIDDGSEDGTYARLQEMRQDDGFEFRLLRQKNSGPAAARNRAVKEARGEIILFLQDDVVAQSNLISEHLKIHQKHDQLETGVVGYTTWHPDLVVTPFMYWLEHGGPQFDYDRIQGREKVDHLAFYTSNLSLRRDFIWPDRMLDESFFAQAGVTGYEDTEWGWRLMQEGLNLYYNSQARAYHYHPQTLEGVCKRRYHLGKLSHMLSEKHPDLKMSGESGSLWHNLTHLRTGFLTDSQRFRLTHWLLNPATFWPFWQVARFIEDKLCWPLIFKIVCGYQYNRGYGQELRRRKNEKS